MVKTGSTHGTKNSQVDFIYILVCVMYSADSAVAGLIAVAPVLRSRNEKLAKNAKAGFAISM